jgi:hypothetical protein
MPKIIFIEGKIGAEFRRYFDHHRRFNQAYSHTFQSRVEMRSCPTLRGLMSNNLQHRAIVQGLSCETALARIHTSDDGFRRSKSRSIIQIGFSKPSWTAIAQLQ